MSQPLLLKLKDLPRQLAPVSIAIGLGFVCGYQGTLERKLTTKVDGIKQQRYIEAYPFSHFPMYSGFADFDYIVFIGGKDGKPLPIQKVTRNLEVDELKKKFNGFLKPVLNAGMKKRIRDLSDKELEPFGKQTLGWVMQDHGAALAPYAPLKLYFIGIEVKDGRAVESEPRLIADQKP